MLLALALVLCTFVPTFVHAADEPDKSVPVTGGLRLPVIFSDNMVLQADAAVPVWGWAEAGEEVTLTAAGQTVKAKADEKGKWKAVLAAMKPAENVDFSVKGRTSTITVSNVMVGEVWLAAGQSNMAFGQGSHEILSPKIPPTEDRQLRLFITRQQRFSEEPLDDLAAPKGSGWVIANPKTIGDFSAVGYYFGRDLRAEKKRPVGVILSAIGGVPVQTFISRAVLSANPELKPLVEKSEKSYRELQQKAADFDKNNPKAPKQNEADPAKAVTDEGQPAGKPLRPKAEINPAWAGVAYNSKIAPIIPYAIKGVIWYQGESNLAEEYRLQFNTMINEWRSEWGQGEFPFIFVQITHHNAYFREVQGQIAKTVPNTAMVVISDFSQRGAAHPVDKEPVGGRLVLAARALAYGEKIEGSGPVYESVKFQGSKAIVTFSHLGGGLVAREGTLKGFQLAGADKKFETAQAEIVGDTVVVTCDAVATPIAIRYGFLDRPITKEVCEANGCFNDGYGAAKYCPAAWLANKAGLPAPPFRSDSWRAK